MVRALNWLNSQALPGTEGEAFPLAEQVSRTGHSGYFGFSASQNGVLAYITGGLQWTSELLWFDREGKRLSTVGKPGTYWSLSLSPDEKRVAVNHMSSTLDTSDIWIHELTRDSSSPFTFGRGVINSTPVWSPDGSRIAFSSDREGNSFIYQKDTSGTGKEGLLLQTKFILDRVILDWSHDGRFIVYEETDAKTKFNLWLLPMTGDHKPVPLLQTEFNETQGQFSPDGRWVAYTSDESGIGQIYVRPFPASGGKWMVSTSGGRQPRWRGDGKELFYVAPDGQLMAVEIRAGSSSKPFEATVPKALFQAFQAGVLDYTASFYFFSDVTADGRRFLINTVPKGGNESAINVVVN